VSTKIKIVVILGPTAVGKTSAALALAPFFNGEIIGADSMQVYRYMNIGTAKPTEEERKRITHHLIDVADPDETYSAARFADEAHGCIEAIAKKSKIPFIVGGTGLYIDSLLGGLLDGPPADHELRTEYKKLLSRYGSGYLHQLLARRDKISAAKIHPHDSTRVIRALEVFEHTGTSIVTRQREQAFGDERYQYIKIGLNMERSLLFEKIEQRTSRMIREGLVEEVESLIERNYKETCAPLQSFNYRTVIEHLKGAHTVENMEGIISRDTRHYAKRQLAWFKRDSRILWFNPDEISGIEKEIEYFLRNSRSMKKDGCREERSCQNTS
jgi:tRNA dimethylallyltransferase